MRKIPVTVRIPAIHGNYEFLIPDNMSVADAQKLMVRILNSEYGIADNSSDLILIDEKDGKSLDRNVVSASLGLQMVPNLYCCNQSEVRE